MISRVNRKKSATIPTIPRKSGPKRPCRYDTRPFVLSARGAAVSEWNIGLLRTYGDYLAAGEATRRGAGSWLPPGLDRRGDAAHVPSPVLPHNRERIGHLEPGRWRLARLRSPGWLTGDVPDDRSNNMADGPAWWHRDRGQRAELHCAAQAGHRGAGFEEPAERDLVAVRVSREKLSERPGQRRLRGRVVVGLRGRWRHGGLGRGQPRRLPRDHRSAGRYVHRHAELHQPAVHPRQQRHHRMMRILYGHAGDLLRLQCQRPGPVPAQL